MHRIPLPEQSPRVRNLDPEKRYGHHYRAVNTHTLSLSHTHTYSFTQVHTKIYTQYNQDIEHTAATVSQTPYTIGVCAP